MGIFQRGMNSNIPNAAMCSFHAAVYSQMQQGSSFTDAWAAADCSSCVHVQQSGTTHTGAETCDTTRMVMSEL